MDCNQRYQRDCQGDGIVIVVRLMGGLGNQMYQYAIGRGLEEKNNNMMLLDTSFLENRTPGFVNVFRDYELNLFPKLKEKLVDATNVDHQGHIQVIHEPHFHYSNVLMESTLPPDHNYLLIGHWQTPKYFEDISDSIREEFSFPDILEPKTLKLQEEILSCNSVMINVRRSDYLTDNLFEDLGMDYFNKCIDEISKKVDNAYFYVFSDDIEWCKENFKTWQDRFFIVDKSYAGHKYIDYLHLMSCCKHDIIPNSTFAWWAAWLNKNEDKIVMYPSKWFTDPSKDPKDMFPEDWIKI